MACGLFFVIIVLSASATAFTFGGFAPNATVWSGNKPRCIAGARIDADPYEDLLIGMWTFVVWVRGGGYPLHVLPIGASSTAYPWSVIGADMDSDGDNDVAITWSSFNYVSLYKNNGTGGFDFGTTVDSSCPNGFHITAEDVTGDGHRDFVFSCHAVGPPPPSPEVRLVENNNGGPGNFFAAIVFASLTDAIGSAVGDLDGDGILDVVMVAYFNNGLHWRRGSGGNVFAASAMIGTGFGFARAVLAAHMNGDTKIDLVVVSSMSYLLHNVGVGAGAAVFIKQAIGVFGDTFSGAVGDIDGNGRTDVVIGAAYGAAFGNVTVLLNGGVVVSPNVTFTVVVVSRGDSYRVALLDWNADGTLDIFTNWESAGLVLWVKTIKLSSPPPPPSPPPLVPSPPPLALPPAVSHAVADPVFSANSAASNLGMLSLYFVVALLFIGLVASNYVRTRNRRWKAANPSAFESASLAEQIVRAHPLASIFVRPVAGRRVVHQLAGGLACVIQCEVMWVTAATLPLLQPASSNRTPSAKERALEIVFGAVVGATLSLLSGATAVRAGLTSPHPARRQAAAVIGAVLVPLLVGVAVGLAYLTPVLRSNAHARLSEVAVVWAASLASSMLVVSPLLTAFRYYAFEADFRKLDGRREGKVVDSVALATADSNAANTLDD